MASCCIFGGAANQRAGGRWGRIAGYACRATGHGARLTLILGSRAGLLAWVPPHGPTVDSWQAPIAYDGYPCHKLQLYQILDPRKYASYNSRNDGYASSNDGYDSYNSSYDSYNDGYTG